MIPHLSRAQFLDLFSFPSSFSFLVISFSLMALNESLYAENPVLYL